MNLIKFLDGEPYMFCGAKEEVVFGAGIDINNIIIHPNPNGSGFWLWAPAELVMPHYSEDEQAYAQKIIDSKGEYKPERTEDMEEIMARFPFKKRGGGEK